MTDFWMFALVGLIAQLVDGTLGMGFGVISSSVLLAQGVPPALASASVNAAKLLTTSTAAASHFAHKNFQMKLVISVGLFGAIGGIIGAVLLTGLKTPLLNYVINAYLLLVGVLIIYRALRDVTPHIMPAWFSRFVGFVGGLIEGIGGSWGPIITPGLMASGVAPRFAIGTANIAEFFVSVAVFSTFVSAYFLGFWQGGSDWRQVFYPVAGLVCGGLPAAWLGGYLSKITRRRELTVCVGLLAISIGLYRFIYA